MRQYLLIILTSLCLSTYAGTLKVDSLKATMKEWKDSVRTDIQQYKDSVDMNVKQYRDSIKTNIKEWKASGKPASEEWSQPDIYYFKDGKLIQKIGGKIIIIDSKQTLSNGTTVSTTGSVKMKNGTTAQLKNGDSINKNGTITRFKAETKMKAEPN